jgi:transketolase
MADLKAIASQIRRDILRMVHGVSSGHPGGSLGCADFFTALYFEIMNHNPKFSMDGKNEDIVLLKQRPYFARFLFNPCPVRLL